MVDHEGGPHHVRDVAEAPGRAFPALQFERRQRAIACEDVPAVDGLHQFSSFGGHRFSGSAWIGFWRSLSQLALNTQSAERTEYAPYAMPLRGPCRTVFFPVVPAERKRGPGPILSAVMPALVAGIHVLAALQDQKTWMAGTSPAMTPSVAAPAFLRFNCQTAKRHRPYSLSRPRGGLSSFHLRPMRGNGAPCGATSGPTPCGVDVPCEARSPHGAPPAAFLSAGTVLPGADTASRRLSPPFVHAASSH